MGARRRIVQALPAVFLLVGSVPAARADDVYLDNGGVFEGVVAEAQGAQVSIHLAFGDLVLPRDRVLRIERKSSDLEEYLTRRDALGARPDAVALLDLARWADGHGLEHNAREAAERAARIDPDLASLAPLMRRLGFERLADDGPWVTYEEAMRRRGFVEAAGGWITPAELAARRAEGERRETAAAERRRLESTERLAAAAEALAAASIVQSQAPQPVLPVSAWIPIASFPGFFSFGPGHPLPAARPRGPGALPSPRPPAALRPPAATSFGVFQDFLSRPPGSLIPTRLDLSSPTNGTGR